MKKILLRVDFNVPLKHGVVADDFRIRSAVPTINKLLSAGHRVFLITHLEENNKTPHLSAVRMVLERFLKTRVGFLEGRIPKRPCFFNEKIVLFDNIRLNKGEKENDLKFARRLSYWGDMYINEAFSASHRKHASIVGIPKFLPGSLGPLFKNEIKNLEKFFEPKHPFMLILGGKKFSTKEPLIRRFLDTADGIFVGGALGNTFLNQRGVNVGKSKIEDEKIPKNILWSPKIFLPEDAVVLRNKKKKHILISDAEKNDFIYDVGTKTVNAISALSSRSKSILWNGTLGFCENGFTEGTKKFGEAIRKIKAFRVVGGGDTVAAVRTMNLESSFDFISTGGGAMLEFLADGTLPGIEALKKH